RRTGALGGGGDLGDGGAEALDVGEPGGGVLHVAAGAGGVPGDVEAGEAAIDEGALAVLVVVGGDQVAGGAVDERLHAGAGLDGGDGDALEEVLQAGGEEVPARHADLLLGGVQGLQAHGDAARHVAGHGRAEQRGGHHVGVR